MKVRFLLHRMRWTQPLSETDLPTISLDRTLRTLSILGLSADVFMGLKSSEELKRFFRISPVPLPGIILEKVHDLIVEVRSIRGNCPVHKEGDRIVFRRGYRLDMTETDALCTHAMGCLIPFLSPLSRGTDPASLGLAKKGKVAFVQCPDPGEPYTRGGTVTFAIRRAD